MTGVLGRQEHWELRLSVGLGAGGSAKCTHGGAAQARPRAGGLGQSGYEPGLWAQTALG